MHTQRHYLHTSIVSVDLSSVNLVNAVIHILFYFFFFAIASSIVRYSLIIFGTFQSTEKKTFFNEEENESGRDDTRTPTHREREETN